MNVGQTAEGAELIRELQNCRVKIERAMSIQGLSMADMRTLNDISAQNKIYMKAISEFVVPTEGIAVLRTAIAPIQQFCELVNEKLSFVLNDTGERT